MEQTPATRPLISRRGMMIIGILVVILLLALVVVFSFPGFDVWTQDYIQTVVPRL